MILVTPPTAAQNPIQKTPGLLMYWDAYDLTLAEGANATTWTDRVGNVATLANLLSIWANGVAGTFEAGGCAGNPAVNFGTLGGLATPSYFNGSYAGFTTFQVIAPTAFTASGYSVDQQIFGSNYGTSYVSSRWWLNTDASTGGQAMLVGRFQSNSVQISSPAQSRLTAYRPIVVMYVYNAGVASLWIDGQCAASAATVSNPGTISGPAFMGHNYDGDSMAFKLSANGCYGRALNVSEIRNISSYLYNRFVADYRPRVYVIGDSFGSGQLASANQTYCDLLQAAMPGVRFINACIPAPVGTAANWAANGAPFNNLMDVTKPGDGVIIWPGSADVAAQTAAATIYGYETSIIANVHSRGGWTVMLSMIPKSCSTNGATQTACEAIRISLNTLILANSAGSDYVFDNAGVSPFTSPTIFTNATYYAGAAGGDYTGTHPTTAAYALLAPGAVAITQQALGYPTLANIQLRAGVTPVADGTVTPLTSETTKGGFVTALS